MTTLRLGPVHLKVADRRRLEDFYQEALGFQIHRRDSDSTALGAGQADLLVLKDHPGGRSVRRTTGLYHFAVLVPSRFDLARSLRQFALLQTPMQGFSDHGVSEALYLADPEGNGIEVYRDRPRAEWPFQGDRLGMVTQPLDLDSLIGELTSGDATSSALHPDTVIGHVHLHVSDIDQARLFYTDLLGLDVMQRYGPSAMFVSADGYHHHIGLNTWAGVGAPPPPPDATGLRWYEIHWQNHSAYDEVQKRLSDAAVSLTEQDGGCLVYDPAGNGVLLKRLEANAE